MATARGFAKPTRSWRRPHRSPHHELSLHVLDKCRELVDEYTELARRDPEAFPFSRSELTNWYAEMRYKLLGPGRCSLCGTSVRHVLPVMAEIDENTVVLHPCLCSHCLASQESAARRVIICLQQPGAGWQGGVGTASAA